MNLLAFDTATEQMSIAIAIGDDVRGSEAPGGALASAALVPAVMALLARVGVRLHDLDAIAFGRGPGAFTGLRTACAVAQGLAFGAGKPVLPIDTLLAVAESARDTACRAAASGSSRPTTADFSVWALLDARMDELYAARYRHGTAGWRLVDAPMLTTPAALNERWQREAPEAVAGRALSVYADRLDTRGASLHAGAAPRAESMLPLARALWEAGGALDPALALPLYLRDKVAQTTLERDAARAAKEAEKEAAKGKAVERAGSPP